MHTVGQSLIDIITPTSMPALSASSATALLEDSILYEARAKMYNNNNNNNNRLSCNDGSHNQNFPHLLPSSDFVLYVANSNFICNYKNRILNEIQTHLTGIWPSGTFKSFSNTFVRNDDVTG